MTAKSTKATEEAQIRRLIDDQIKAVRAKDSSGVVSNYSSDVVSFDVIDPLQYTGSDAVKKRADEWFSSFEGPISYEVHDLSITVGDDVAFSHSLNRVNGGKSDGQKIDMWWRATACYRKIDDRWIVTHLHSSVPFKMDTGKASVDLKP